MCPITTVDTCQMASRAPLSTICQLFEVFCRWYKDSTVQDGAVVTVFDWRHVFPSFLSVLYFEVSRNVFEALSVLDGVETTSGWPVCFGLYGVGDETTKTRSTVVVALQPNKVPDDKVIKTRDAFSVMTVQLVSKRIGRANKRLDLWKGCGRKCGSGAIEVNVLLGRRTLFAPLPAIFVWHA